MMAKSMIVDGLETERLRFRRLTLDDVEPWREFMSSPEAVKYLLIDPNDSAASLNWINKQLARYAENRGGHCAVCDKETGELLGQCGILYQDLETGGEWEVGYHLFPKFWGKGYATEAAIAVKEEGFRRGLKTIISLIVKDNIPSQKVALRNGMINEKDIQFMGFDLFLFRAIAGK